MRPVAPIPTDPVATASAYRQAVEQGVKLVFMDNVPQGFTPGTDYVSVVSADNYGNGVVSAHLMAKALGAKGKIGLIFHEADFFVTRQRYEGFKKTVQSDYPEMQIVEEQGIAGPDFAGDAQGVANAMIIKHSDLTGIWAVWDVPAEGVMAAVRASGRGDLRVATEDARFGFAERRWGVPLIDGGTQRLPRIVGWRRAMELIVTGRVIDAEEALRIGLVNEVVPRGTCRQRARELAHARLGQVQHVGELVVGLPLAQYELDDRPLLRRKLVERGHVQANCSVPALVDSPVDSYPAPGTLDDALGFELLEARMAGRRTRRRGA
jgi:hypothetical protein